MHDYNDSVSLTEYVVMECGNVLSAGVRRAFLSEGAAWEWADHCARTLGGIYSVQRRIRYAPAGPENTVYGS